MRTIERRNAFRMKLLAAATLVALAPAYADDAVDELAKPSSSVSVGVAGLSGDSRDRSLFGQYNGLRDEDLYLLLDVDYSRRNEATGLWSTMTTRYLGTDSRELRAAIDRQGDFKVFGEYWQLTRAYPRTVNTSLQGAGTSTPVVSRLAEPGTGADLDLKTERKRFTVGGEKWLGASVVLDAAFTSEDKQGARIFGRGFTCPSGAAPAPVCTPMASGVNQWALLMLPEPIDSTSRQFEAKATFVGERFSVTTGYYGAFYENNVGNLTNSITGNLNNPLGNPMGQGGGVPLTAGLRNILSLPMTLPPDSEAHQLYVSGTWLITPTTRATFKYAHTRATQEDDFRSRGFNDAPAGIANYGGRLDTNLAQLGVVARPMPKLTINANLRYEDRDDKSPLALYNIEGAERFTNGTYSLEKMQAKLEASYLFPWKLRATAGVDWEHLDRGQFSSPRCIPATVGDEEECVGQSIAGITALRAETDELTYRMALRRALGESVNGSVTLSHAERNGSDWLRAATAATPEGVPVSDEAIFNRTGIFPAMFMDRKRDKARVVAEWEPVERVSVQFTAEGGRDDYSAPTTKGLDKTGFRLFGVDTTFAISGTWKATAYYSYSEQRIHVAHSTGYIAALKDRNQTAGLNVTGNPSPRLHVGADLLVTNDRNIYAQTLDAQASAANIAFLERSGGLPDVVFRELRLRLFGTWAIDRRSSVRVELIHDRQQLDEWTWGANGTPFLYSDNTTVSLQPRQNVTFLGVAWQYRFR
jgi:MtrB/PioB family decaheme-associated outer membrane protein